MQETAWRYHPEFLVTILIDGQNSGDAVSVSPSLTSAGELRNYGLLVRAVPGGLLACVRQRRSGTGWIPAVEIDEPRIFSFWLTIRQGSGIAKPDFFNHESQTFGRQILYANNLTGTGEIDDNLAGDVVRLTVNSQVGDTERGALSPYHFSISMTPGDFTLIRAGEIVAGGPVSFSISRPIHPGDSTVALDFTLLPKGAHVVRLEGASPVQECVVLDQQAARAQVNGIIDIFRDAWHTPAQPREYRLDFSST